MSVIPLQASNTSQRHAKHIDITLTTSRTGSQIRIFLFCPAKRAAPCVLGYIMGFQDEDLDESTVNFEHAALTPHRIHGTGMMVYWKDCDVTLMRLVEGGLEFVRHVGRRTGKGRLDAGDSLVFMGEGGKVRTG